MKMKLFLQLFLCVMCIGVVGLTAFIAIAQDGNTVIEKSSIPLKLWYDEEAIQENENSPQATNQGENEDIGWAHWSLPIGNGYVGANVFGRTETERIQITEKTLMQPTSVQDSSGTYHTIGGLNSFSETYIDFGHTNSEVTDYSRYLDLETAISGVEYTYDNVKYSREYFTSYPDKAIVIKLDADTEGALDFTLRPTIAWEQSYGAFEGDRASKIGTVTSTVDNGVGCIELSGKMGFYDIDFMGQYRVYTDGGTVTATTVDNGLFDKDGTTPVSADDGAIKVENANSAYIVITLGTDYELSSDMFVYLTETDKPTYTTDMDDTRAKVEGDMNALIANRIQGKSFDDAYAALREKHVEDHSGLFGRVSLDLDCKESDMALTTDELLAQYKGGTNKSTYLDTLIFQYGRYLLVASSREGTLPATLQGAWNTYNTPAWACAYTHNINIQMNYWPAFNTNLAETFQSYVEYNQAYMTRAQMYADKVIQQYYPDLYDKDGGNGFVVGNHNYPYRVTTDSSAGNLGLTTQMFWDYYDFTQDSEVLEDIYPVLVEAARYITKCVEYNAEEDAYLVAYCDSPEVHVNGVWYYTSGTTYAQTFAYLNNYHALLAAKEMGINLEDTDLLSTEEYSILSTIMEQIDKYDPIHVGLSGQIKEFREEDYYSSIGDDPHHRHISQLMALYPGDIINSNTPAWLDAAEVTLTKRGDTGMGWSRAHKMSLWARVKNGDRAYSLLDNLISNRTNENLWNAGPPFQIDGSFGATAGVAEMLLQSHEGYIAPLSAIPEGWADGSYTGLVARGNFEVSAAWENGLAKTFNITSNSGGTAKVYYPSITGARVETADGTKVDYTVEGNLISFDTEVGQTYIIYGFEEVATPDAPTELKCDSDSDSHEISWAASAGADSYNVYVAVEDEATYTLVGTTSDTSYSYVPENGDMTARTTIAVTAVSEGESDRTITYTAESIKTEYGTIPSSKITEDVSFAIFAKNIGDEEYTFVDTYANFVGDALYTAGDLLADTYAGGEIVVYMFKEHTSSGTVDGGAAWNRAFQINGAVTVDLGGYTLTSTAPRLVGFEAKATGYDYTSSVTFKNGTICTAKVIAEVFGSSVYTGTKNYELTFDNIDFVSKGTVSDFVMVKTRGSYSSTQKANFNLKLTNCDINYDTYTKTTLINDTCTAGTVACDVEVQGGALTATSLDTFVFSNGLASEDSMTFTKNASGDRMQLTLDYTDSCPENVFKTENGEVQLASISVDATGQNVYTISDAKTPYGYVPEASTKKTFSLLYNGLHFNSYDTYASAVDKAKSMLYAADGEYKEGTVAIYMHKSYEYSATAYANFAQIDGTYILDLGGNTLTQRSNYLFDVVGKAVNNTILNQTNVIVKNGTILTNDEPIMKINSKGTSGNFGYSGTKTYDFTYEDITFGKSTYATGYKPLISVSQFDEVNSAKNLYLYATFNNCSFTSSDSLLFDLSVSNCVDSNIKIKGGHLTTDDTSTNFILKGSDSNDKLSFAKDSDGKYMSLTVPTGVAVPTNDFDGLKFVQVSSDATTDTYRLKNPADAEDDGGVTYESLSMSSYWSTDKKTAPTKVGYVFGGWFTKSGNTYTALKAAEITTGNDGKANVSDTYAKFVPAQVLSVKAQNASGTAANDSKAASVRVISALDSTDYQKVGFKVLVNNKNDLGTLETTQIYNGLQVDGDSSSPYSASDIFGAPAAYLSVWRLDNIADKNDAKILNVTPYWITMDGTKVEGLTKYVHVEDGYMGYISVPVNLCDVKAIAAGKVEIKYPAGLTLVKDKVEFDGVFKGAESAFYDDGNGIVRVAGNAETVNKAKTADGIFVNLRFKANSTSVYPGAGKGTFLTFGVTGEDFCDWSKNTISIDAWDVQY